MKKEVAYIRSICLLGMQEESGVEKSVFLSLLKDAGIPVEAYDNFDMLISFNGFCLLFERLAHISNRPALAIEFAVATAPNYPSLGAISALADFATTMEGYFDLAVRSWNINSNAFTLQLLRGDNENPSIFRLKGHSYIIPSRQFAESYTANVVGLSREAMGKADAKAIVVRFQHSKPIDPVPAENFFRCPVEYDCPHTEIVFPTEYLSSPCRGRLWLLRPLVNYHIKRRIERTVDYDQSAAATVALAIPSLLGTGRCDIEHIAETFGMTMKQLQRQLEKENTTFSTVLQHVRETLAKQMLLETDVPVSNIANLLDYAGNPPFTLAFERWTGQNPTTFRKEERKRLGMIYKP
jgi:AraC-like DNA-binding protein